MLRNWGGSAPSTTPTLASSVSSQEVTMSGFLSGSPAWPCLARAASRRRIRLRRIGLCLICGIAATGLRRLSGLPALARGLARVALRLHLLLGGAGDLALL